MGVLNSNRRHRTDTQFSLAESISLGHSVEKFRYGINPRLELCQGENDTLGRERAEDEAAADVADEQIRQGLCP